MSDFQLKNYSMLEDLLSELIHARSEDDIANAWNAALREMCKMHDEIKRLQDLQRSLFTSVETRLPVLPGSPSEFLLLKLHNKVKGSYSFVFGRCWISSEKKDRPVWYLDPYAYNLMDSPPMQIADDVVGWMLVSDLLNG